MGKVYLDAELILVSKVLSYFNFFRKSEEDLPSSISTVVYWDTLVLFVGYATSSLVTLDEILWWVGSLLLSYNGMAEFCTERSVLGL